MEALESNKANKNGKEDCFMEGRMVKFYSKESNKLAMHVVPGHFATSNSHINYYIDVTSIKTRVSEAKEAAGILGSKMNFHAYADTIVCMDGTEMIGAFLAEKLQQGKILSTNKHETLYVISPEMNSSNQIIFRDNMKNKIAGKHVILLLDTTTTGETIRRSMEGIRYYGGIIERVVSVFSTIQSVDGMHVDTVFSENDIPGYQTNSQSECPFCAKGMMIEAMVNGYGYSKL